jgi:hypothetical protein
MCDEIHTTDGEQLLGEIATTFLRLSPRQAGIAFREQVNLEVDATHSVAHPAIRVENGRFEPIGYLPDELAQWLAPLLQAGKIRVEGYCASVLPEDPAGQKQSSSLVLSIFLCKSAVGLLDKPIAKGELGALHERAYRAYLAMVVESRPHRGFARGTSVYEAA